MGDKMSDDDIKDLIYHIRNGITVPEHIRTQYIQDSMKKTRKLSIKQSDSSKRAKSVRRGKFKKFKTRINKKRRKRINGINLKSNPKKIENSSAYLKL